MEPLICILPLPGEPSDAPEPPTDFFSGSPQKVYRSGTTSYSPKPYTCSNQDSSRVEDSWLCLHFAMMLSLLHWYHCIMEHTECFSVQISFLPTLDWKPRRHCFNRKVETSPFNPWRLCNVGCTSSPWPAKESNPWAFSFVSASHLVGLQQVHQCRLQHLLLSTALARRLITAPFSSWVFHL